MKKLWPVLILILMVSCSSPLKKTYNRDSFEKDMAQIMAAYRHDTSVMAGMTKLSLYIKAGKDQKFKGKSYQEIITDSKNDNLNFLKK